MIYANLKKINIYLPADICKLIEPFLNTVSKSMDEKEYIISGTKIFARVMRYATSVPDRCRVEAHNEYIDIQFSICGAEGISVFDRHSLKTAHKYDKENDVEFLLCDGDKRLAHTINLPGYFTLLFPQEAHRPQENVLGYDSVKKCVIKVHKSLFGGEGR